MYGRVCAAGARKTCSPLPSLDVPHSHLHLRHPSLPLQSLPRSSACLPLNGTCQRRSLSTSLPRCAVEGGEEEEEAEGEGGDEVVGKYVDPTRVGVALPQAIRPRELSQLLGITIQRVMAYCRENRFRDKKESELVLDYYHASELASQVGVPHYYHDFDLIRRDYWDRETNVEPKISRPMVVSILGHVNHGKTTLMDQLRRANVVEQEPGRITQALTIFSVSPFAALDASSRAAIQPTPSPPVRKVKGGKRRRREREEAAAVELTTDLGAESLLPTDSVGGEVVTEDPYSRWETRMTMLDTPGHAAFFLMRENGASVSDYILLIIASDEGVGTQTEEVIDIARDSNMPIVVAINKVDIASPEQIENIYSYLHTKGLLSPDITRETNITNSTAVSPPASPTEFPVEVVVEISALKGQNIHRLVDELFGRIPLIDGFMRPRVDDPYAECTVIESQATEGLGRVLRVIVHWGYLEVGAHFITERFTGKIRSLVDDNGKFVQRAYAGDPVTIAGFKGAFPPSGSGLFVRDEDTVSKVKTLRSLMTEFKMKDMHHTLYLDANVPSRGVTTPFKDRKKLEEELLKEREAKRGDILTEEQLRRKQREAQKGGKGVDTKAEHPITPQTPEGLLEELERKKKEKATREANGEDLERDVEHQHVRAHNESILSSALSWEKKKDEEAMIAAAPPGETSIESEAEAEAKAEAEPEAGSAAEMEAVTTPPSDLPPPADRFVLPVIIKADNVGRLETLLQLIEKTASEGNSVVSVIAQGVGNVTTTDLRHAAIEVESNKHSLVPVYCFGNSISLDTNAKKYLQNNPNLKQHLVISSYNVIYDLIRNINETVRRVNNDESFEEARERLRKAAERDSNQMDAMEKAASVKKKKRQLTRKKMFQ